MPSATTVRIENVTKASSICSAGLLANTFVTRLCGLLGKRELSPDSCLLITPSSGVHTFGMRFDIDVVSLNREHRVLGVWEQVKPWRVCGLSRETHSVLELCSGSARKSNITVGDRLRVTHVSPPKH